MDQYEKTGGAVIGCQRVREEQVSSYGIIDGVKTEDPDLVKVLDMIEKPSIEEAPQPHCSAWTLRHHSGNI